MKIFLRTALFNDFHEFSNNSLVILPLLEKSNMYCANDGIFRELSMFKKNFYNEQVGITNYLKKYGIAQFYKDSELFIQNYTSVQNNKKDLVERLFLNFLNISFYVVTKEEFEQLERTLQVLLLSKNIFNLEYTIVKQQNRPANFHHAQESFLLEELFENFDFLKIK